MEEIKTKIRERIEELERSLSQIPEDNQSPIHNYDLIARISELQNILKLIE